MQSNQLIPSNVLTQIFEVLKACDIHLPEAKVEKVLATFFPAEPSPAPAQAHQAPTGAPAVAMLSASEIIEFAEATGHLVRIQRVRAADGSGSLSTRVLVSRDGGQSFYGRNVAQADALEQFEKLLGADVPLHQAISQVVTLADGSASFITISGFIEHRPNGYTVRTVDVEAKPFKAPALRLEQLGITQVNRWYRSFDQEEGLYVVHGSGVRTTVRATAEKLRQDGARVVWVDNLRTPAELEAMNADVYVFSRPIRASFTPAVLHALVALSVRATVICSFSEMNEQEVYGAFLTTVSEAALTEVLRAMLFQALTDAHDDAEPSGQTTLVSQVLCIEGINDVRGLADGSTTLLNRHILVDAAEKVRHRVISKESAFDFFGPALDAFL